jgi:hypothetical protein
LIDCFVRQPDSVATRAVVCGLQGSISFPIFVLHGALGQLFYKKIVATKVRNYRMQSS